MAPGLTILPGFGLGESPLGTEVAPGAMGVAEGLLAAGATGATGATPDADETSSRHGYRVNDGNARRLVGAAQPRVAVVRHDVARFADSFKEARRDGEVSLVTETSAWPFPVADFLARPFAVSPRALERLHHPMIPQVFVHAGGLIDAIFGGGTSSNFRTPAPAARAVRTPFSSSDGPDVFRSRVFREAPPQRPRPFSPVLDPLGTGEFIRNPLVIVAEMMASDMDKPVVDPTEPYPANPITLEFMTTEAVTAVALRCTGLRAEIRQGVDSVFTRESIGVTMETQITLEATRDSLKLAYDKAFTRVSQVFARARQEGVVVLDHGDVEALLTLAGYRGLRLLSFFGYQAFNRITMAELTRLIRDEVLGPRGTERRADDVQAASRLARLNRPSFTGAMSARLGTTFPGVTLDGRGIRPEERRDDTVDPTDTPLITGATASAGANADADDQGEQRDNPNQ